MSGFWNLIKDALLDAGSDSLHLLLFLFLTYLVMEIFERNAGPRAYRVIAKANHVGPIWGALLGVIPQCGFSTVASNLFAGRMLTIGTLFAVYLSTSDEMLPIMISSGMPVATMAKILFTKVLLGMAWGFVVELFFLKNKPEMRIPTEEEMAESEGCECCRPNVFVSAIAHSIKVLFFIFLISFLLDLVIGAVGEDTLAGVFSALPVFNNFLLAFVGLIPNCASSVIITELYMEGIVSFGPMMAGLLVNAGVGLLVLFRENASLRENLTITAILYGIGAVSGLVLELIGFVI